MSLVFVKDSRGVHEQDCHNSSVTITLRTMTGFSSKHKSQWLTACSLFACMNAPVIHRWEKRRSVSTDSCTEQGGKMAALCPCPVCLSAGVHLKHLCFRALISVETCSLDLPVNPGFSFFFCWPKKGRYKRGN